MPRQVSDFSPSELRHLDELKAQHDAEKAKEKARAARSGAERNNERKKDTQQTPRQENLPAKARDEKIRRAPSKGKEPLGSGSGKPYRDLTREDNTPRDLGKNIDAARRQVSRDFEKPRELSKDVEAAKRHVKDLEKPHRVRSKDGEKQGHSKDKVNGLSRHGSGKNSQSMHRTATSAQRPERRRSQGTSTLKKSSIISEEPRERKSDAKTKASRETACPSPRRKLSIVTEIPGSFIDTSFDAAEMPSTEVVVKEAPQEAPITPAVAQAPRALFHINGPLVNLNFNLWGGK